MIHRLLVLPLLLLCPAPPAAAEPHPIIPCVVERVIDGDTLQATCRPWPGLVTEVRVLEIDTPERGHRAQCEREAQLAELATTAAEELLQGNIRLTVEGRDSFGRILAHVTLADHRDYGQVMLRRDLALLYEERNRGWC